MDGIHDLGGMHGFGPVVAEADEPVFHADWERRTMPLPAVLMVNRLANTSAFRHAIERMDPAHYLSSPYYEHWLTAVATLLVEAGVTTAAELDAQAGGHVPLSRPVRGVAPPEPVEPAAFAVGDAVRVREWHPSGHTRAPRYVQGRRGTVVRVGPAVAVPDVEAHFPDPPKEPTYCVRFEAAELWGEAGAGGDPVHVDLWARYLEAAR